MVKMKNSLEISPTANRKQDVLNAAAKLFLQYGFDKTTVSDIAIEAGISKGAIYLHFESKDSLLEALIVREMQSYALNWMEAVEADPMGGKIGNMYRCALRALSDNLIMAALLRQDARVFGTYLRRPHNLLKSSRSNTSRKEFVAAMQEIGAIRSDVNPTVTAHIMNMISHSLVAMHQNTDTHDIPTVDALLNGIADLLDRALTPEDGGNNEGGKTIIRKLYESSISKLNHARGE